jgi:hypothetical protein
MLYQKCIDQFLDLQIRRCNVLDDSREKFEHGKTGIGHGHDTAQPVKHIGISAAIKKLFEALRWKRSGGGSASSGGIAGGFEGEIAGFDKLDQNPIVADKCNLPVSSTLEMRDIDSMDFQDGVWNWSSTDDDVGGFLLSSRMYSGPCTHYYSGLPTSDFHKFTITQL